MEIPIKPSKGSVIVSYGEKFYKVEADVSQDFYDDCPVCDNTNKIVVKGYEFPCPYCRLAGSTTPLLRLLEYRVYEYRVYALSVIARESFVMNVGNEPEKGLGEPEISGVRAYRVVNDGGFRQQKVSLIRNLWDREYSKIQGKSISSYCWHDKEKANRVCVALHKAQMKKLEEFNKEHNTELEYPFKEYC